jgi:pimeloyl-ACP methyl ester carboxylesterase
MYSKKSDGSKFIQIENQKVHYKMRGKGKPLLLIHGICDSLHTWRLWEEGLVAEGFQYISIDLPGYGLTGKWDKEYSTENYLLLIHNILKKLNINQPVSIIGNSLGGYMAWNFAIKFPKKVDKLVLISPAAYPMSPPLVVHFGQDRFTRWIAKNFTTEFIFKKLASSVFYDTDKMSKYDSDRFYHLSLIEGNHEAYMDTFEEILKLVDQEPKLERLKTKTLLLWGEKDAWIPFKQSKLWQRDVKDLTLKSYKNIGHVAHLENAKKSLIDALTFLKTE